MLIVSGIFFNAHGNQSMLNSLKGYQERYDLTLITAADLSSSSYLSKKQVAVELPRLKVICVWPYPIVNLLRGTFRGLCRFLPTRSRSVSAEQAHTFANTSASIATIAAFWLRAWLLIVAATIFVLLNRVHAACAYEINGLAALGAVKKISSKTLLFGKFQGSIMGPSMAKTFDPVALKKNYPLDYGSMRHLKNVDCAIMTNDGTHGDLVLERFGVDHRDILFIPNGIDPRLEKLLAQPKAFDPRRVSKGYDSIMIVSISRLASWKRVPLAVAAVGAALEIGANLKYQIIGGGSDHEMQRLANAISENRCSQFVEVLGPLPYEEVIEYLLSADILVSLYAETNVCNPVLEALALGVPVLTIEDAKLAAVLGPGIEGCFLVNEEDDESLQVRVAKLLASIDTGAIEHKKAALRNYNPFTWHARAEMELDFLQQRAFEKSK